MHKKLVAQDGYGLTIECDVRNAETRFENRLLGSFYGLVVRRIRGSARTTHTATISLAKDTMMIALNQAGTLLVLRHPTQAWHVLSPNSITFARGPLDAVIYVSRGDHERTIVSWREGDMATLSAWAQAAIRKRDGQTATSAVCTCPIPLSLSETVEDFSRVALNPNDSTTPVLLSGLSTFACEALLSAEEFSLARVPNETIESIHHLMIEVKKDPSRAWSLKDAAAIAGYSPFHLSRTFKALMGYGFPEFVDRCRAEVAVRRLLTTGEGIDEIAMASGFGSTHSLRESTKEYLGLLPSELRTLPDEGRF